MAGLGVKQEQEVGRAAGDGASGKLGAFLGMLRAPFHKSTRLYAYVCLPSLVILLSLWYLQLPSYRFLFQLRVWKSQLANPLQWRSPEETNATIPLNLQPTLNLQPEIRNSSVRQVLNETDRSPRLAVCLVGGARAFELTGPSIKKYLLLVNNNTDVFLHAPLDKDSYKFHLLKGVPNLVSVRIFKPKRLPESRLHMELLTAEGSPNGIQGLLQYFDLVEGCRRMIEKHQSKLNFTYNWIVRTRVDGYWNGPLRPLESFNPEVYTVPEGSQFGGLNDRFGIGNWRTSKIALSRLSLLPTLHLKGLRFLNSESSFKHQLVIKSVKYELNRFPFCVLSHRTYHWPPGHWGVPALSLSSKGALSGAKCRPCTPVATGPSAQSTLKMQARSWGWIGHGDGFQLCDSRHDWERHWEEIFDRVAGQDFAAVRKKVRKQNLTECIQENEEFQKQVEVLDAPSPSILCKEGLES